MDKLMKIRSDDEEDKMMKERKEHELLVIVTHQSVAAKLSLINKFLKSHQH